jgi:hypothetical protein
MKTIWVITSEVNAYEQYGLSYFETAYLEKPNLQQLCNFLYECPLEKATEQQIISVEHLSNGGGRRSFEDSWYYLTEIEEGEKWIIR